MNKTKNMKKKIHFITFFYNYKNFKPMRSKIDYMTKYYKINIANNITNMSIYLQLLSGEVISFENNIISNLSEFLNVEPCRIICFDENFNETKYFSIGKTYKVFVNDSIVKISFRRTIRLEHEYENLPKETILEIDKMGEDAYRYMYNEILYISHNFNEFNEYFYDDKDEEKFEKLLEKYELIPFQDFEDFFDLDEEKKIKIITAYIRECLSISSKQMSIQKYVFI